MEPIAAKHAKLGRIYGYKQSPVLKKKHWSRSHVIPTIMIQRSSLLLAIENLFSSSQDEQALERVRQLAFPVLVEWEQQSEAVRQGLQRTGWWEVLFAQRHPVTYERLKQSAGRRSNAKRLFLQEKEDPLLLWREMLKAQKEQQEEWSAVWGTPEGHQVARNPADEFGVDTMHVWDSHRQELKRDRDIVSIAAASKELGPLKQLWTVPFQNAAILHFEDKVMWIPSRSQVVDPALFTLEHDGGGDAPLVAAVEGRTDIVAAKTAVVAITQQQERDIFLFDQVYQNNVRPTCWRHLVTHQLIEPRRIPVTAMCFVLDGLLLYASADGVLRAHPRSNPLSTYHVEEMHTRVSHLVSLYNVVAMMHSYSTLEVKRVERKSVDPFVAFSSLVLFKTTSADPEYAPLLYGPYCIYRGLDGTWYRVLYDHQEHHASPLPIKVPFKAGRTLLSIKLANWRYWVAVFGGGSPPLEEVVLFRGRVEEKKHLLVAHCIECGEEATHLCGQCTEAAFCLKHGKEAAHECMKMNLA